MKNYSEQEFTHADYEVWQRSHRRGRVCAGILLIFVAVLFFLKEQGLGIPSWVFTWPMILVGVGLITAIKHGFRGIGWFIMIAVGGIFLLDDAFPGFTFDRYKIPLILLLVGFLLIFRPRRRYWRFSKMHKYRRNLGSYSELGAISEDYVQIDNVFAGTKKTIISKDFKGGEIKNVFGGCEIHLMQADITDTATLTIHQQFAGTKIIVPSSWNVKSDIVCILSGIEDQRVNPQSSEKAKTLLLKGQVVMGGVEIVSY
jgi:predicted membrane protein